MVTRNLVQSTIHTSATALAHLPPEEWLGWVAYFFEALEDAAPTEDIDADAMMRTIIEMLQERLERGHW